MPYSQLRHSQHKDPRDFSFMFKMVFTNKSQLASRRTLVKWQFLPSSPFPLPSCPTICHAFPGPYSPSCEFYVEPRQFHTRGAARGSQPASHEDPGWKKKGADLSDRISFAKNTHSLSSGAKQLADSYLMVCSIFTDALCADFLIHTIAVEGHLSIWTEAAFCRIILADSDIGTILTVLYAASLAVIIYHMRGTVHHYKETNEML